MLPLVPQVDLNASGARVRADARFLALSNAAVVVRRRRDREAVGGPERGCGALLDLVRHRVNSELLFSC